MTKRTRNSTLSRRRTRNRLVAVVIAAAVIGAGVTALDIAQAGGWHPAPPQHQTSITGRTATARAAQAAGRTVPAWGPRATTWPTAGAADQIGRASCRGRG